jgi:hypothetical protein
VLGLLQISIIMNTYTHVSGADAEAASPEPRIAPTVSRYREWMHPGDDAAAAQTTRQRPNARTSTMQMSSEDARLAREVVAEYNVVMSALNSVWSGHR